jgi:hypothetical protein
MGHGPGAAGQKDCGGDGGPGSPGFGGGGGGGGGYFGGGGGAGDEGSGGGGRRLRPPRPERDRRRAENERERGQRRGHHQLLRADHDDRELGPESIDRGAAGHVHGHDHWGEPDRDGRLHGRRHHPERLRAVPVGTSGAALCQISDLAVGNDAITAVYSGDSNNLPSAGAVLQMVKAAASSSAGGGSSAASPPVLAPPLVAESPSNAFGFARVRVRPQELRLSFDYPGRGTLDALVTTRRPGSAAAARLRPGPHRVAVGKLHDSADGAVTKTLRIPLTARGRRILARRAKLPLRLSLVFTPDGGQSARQARKFTVHR